MSFLNAGQTRWKQTALRIEGAARHDQTLGTRAAAGGGGGAEWDLQKDRPVDTDRTDRQLVESEPPIGERLHGNEDDGEERTHEKHS